MKFKRQYTTTHLALILWVAWSLCSPAAVHSACATGTALPPFLAAGLDPNLLLMIDNSGSMYDLAYAKEREEGYCYDGTYTDATNNLVESYSVATTYAGYFEASTYYAYNMTTGQFEAQPNIHTAVTACNNYDYYTPGTLCIEINAAVSPKTVTAFVASGNFLNWAAISKLDFQKKILTGGKYDTTNNRLVMESRGCLGRQFVKKIGVKDSGGSTYHLTLGIRPPSHTEQIDASDDTTRIEIFDVTADGFDYDSCRDALDELNSDSPNLGRLKGYVEDCMGYGGGNSSGSMGAFNHSLQECWYYVKHGHFQPGSGTVNSMKNDCEHIYNDGVDPTTITHDDRGYVCYGQYGAVPADGFVGRCWEPASGGAPLVCVDRVCTTEPTSGAAEICNPADNLVYYCSGNYNSKKDTCNKAWLVKQDCTGGGSGASAGWTDDDGDGGDACVEQAIQDYCGIIEVPQVVDPSDSADDTGNIWNAPAVLIDSGVLSQMNEPLIVLNGLIAKATAPSALIQQYADKIRMGAMVFNDDGSLSECSQADPNIFYGCSDASNRDGGQIISYID